MSKRERTRLLVSMVIAAAVGLPFWPVAIHACDFLLTLQQTTHDSFYPTGTEGRDSEGYGHPVALRDHRDR